MRRKREEGNHLDSNDDAREEKEPKGASDITGEGEERDEHHESTEENSGATRVGIEVVLIATGDAAVKWPSTTTASACMARRGLSRWITLELLDVAGRLALLSIVWGCRVVNGRDLEKRRKIRVDRRLI